MKNTIEVTQADLDIARVNRDNIAFNPATECLVATAAQRELGMDKSDVRCGVITLNVGGDLYLMDEATGKLIHDYMACNYDEITAQLPFTVKLEPAPANW